MSIFNKIPQKRLKRNMFDLSHGKKMTVKFGELYPVMVQETLPGDVFRHRHEIFAQFAPLISVLNQRFDLDVRYFFVPNRTVYKNWPEFLSGGDDGSQVGVPPYFSAKMMYLSEEASKVGGIMDYMGLPTLEVNNVSPATISEDMRINAIPFRAYHKIWNEWYRDENLQNEAEVNTTGGEILSSGTEFWDLLKLRKKNYKKDYFTGCLPFPQKGPEVTIPLGVSAPVHWAFDEGMHLAGSDSVNIEGTELYVDGDGRVDFREYNRDDINDNRFSSQHGTNVYMQSDLTDATSASINELRRAFAVQKWLETNARGGTRYVEQMQAHFGERIPDYTVDRSVYIGGSSQAFTIGNVYSTNSNNEGVPEEDIPTFIQGQAVSKAHSSGASVQWKFKTKEHGFILGLLSVVPRAAYFQGVPRFYTHRNDKFDYYWPDFAHLGEQDVQASELYLSGDNSSGKVFGYVPRYAEYKYNHDTIHGYYRTNMATFHDARKFNNEPNLNSQFIEVNSNFNNLNRIFNYIADTGMPIWIDMFHHLRAIRKMPYFGIPKF